MQTFVANVMDAGGSSSEQQAEHERTYVAGIAAYYKELGFKLDVNHILTKKHVDTYVASAQHDWSDGTRTKVRGMLERIGRRVTKKGTWPKKAPQYGRKASEFPYSADERAIIRRAIAIEADREVQRTAHCGFVIGQAFGLARGPALWVRAEDIIFTEAGDVAVQVRASADGPYTRTVLADHQYAEEVVHVCALYGGDGERLITGDFKSTNVHTGRFSRLALPGDLTLNLSRCRSDWWVRRLAPLGLAQLLEAGGVTTIATIRDLIFEAPPVTDADLHHLLTGSACESADLIAAGGDR